MRIALLGLLLLLAPTASAGFGEGPVTFIEYAVDGAEHGECYSGEFQNKAQELWIPAPPPCSMEHATRCQKSLGVNDAGGWCVSTGCPQSAGWGS